MQGILILSHVGFSFVDQLATQVANEGVERYILSSLPEPDNLKRLDDLKDQAEWFRHTRHHELGWNDVQTAIADIQSEGKTIVACVCVWEGYRVIMAEANAYLGVTDIHPDTVNVLTDKYALRRLLFEHGLSEVTVEPLTEDKLLAYQSQNAIKFIKPYRGIASFGAFRLTPDVRWSDIEALHHELQSDTVFQGIFAEQDPFIIEDYIAGTEYSFEILVEGGRLFIVAIHEKTEVSFEKMTTLENACVSPPVSLTAADIDAGRAWLDAVFQLLDIRTGCFHLEAKFNGKRWELIEVNPRVGGSLISQSVEHLTEGYSLLNLWIKLLLQSTRRDANVSQLLSALSLSGGNPSPKNKATFFRVFFGNVGIIERVDQKPGEHKPILSQVFVKPGSVFSSASKENFVGQALWTLDFHNLLDSYASVSRQSTSLIELTYRPQNAPSLVETY
ncbi:ATP-grasp domain-containing protein [Jeongeupia naejangsanensis]|uniref:ATP-grasp domain-containing protein n=1 Tax=Jeongeupia naejangsanensis TaxID=613195 RepID=A0ABS2BHW8_9NEIS|nr:ATP-grasp domain-containing protein [Jeongeupia naejangsanensis]MBM3115194.1 ATP-grasp domain-containing protein [Jeongeupia naejangsanensis]